MGDVGDNVILSWVGELEELEQQIEDLQAAKRDFYAGIRDQHGKATAAGLKAAIRVHRMDSEKRLAADEVDDEAQRILAVIAKGPSRARAPRATREAVPAPATPPHDPETGEVEVPPAPVVPAAERTAPVEPRVPIAINLPITGERVEYLGAPLEPKVDNPAPPALGRLTDELVEDILATSDEEILAEMSEDGIDPEQHAAEMRERLDAAVVATAEAFTPPAFLAGERKSIRPHCLRPESCGGYGRTHCGECQRAAAGKEAA